MFERFKREPAEPDRTTATAPARGTDGNGRTAVAERPGATRTRDETAVAAAPATGRERAPTREGMREARARQRAEYGGINWGAAFFGWLVAVGLGSLLVAILSAAGAAVGLTQGVSTSDATSNAETIGLGGAIALLVVLMIAYYCGGYVAGRMSRFDGARQGFGAWLFGVIVTVLLALAAVILGSEYNVLDQLNLPSLPVGDATLTTGGAIALAAVVIGSLLAAVVGGKAGERYHRKIDRAGYVD
jgi:hypothetical protein